MSATPGKAATAAENTEPIRFPAESSRALGSVFTFYSYKGGVGRSMALANCAALLARQRKSVLIVDMDLEAPGLERFFRVALDPLRTTFRSLLVGDVRTTNGMVDLIAAHRSGRTPDWRGARVKAEVSPRVFVDIITAGKRTPEYAGLVQSLNWPKLYEEHNIGMLFDRLREEWIREYDYVLVDSRTGLTDIGGICTVLLPDALVVLFTTNEQSFEGVLSVFHDARASRQSLAVEREYLLGLPVPTRDESKGEKALAGHWHNQFASAFGDIFRDWIPKNVAPLSVLYKLLIPYEPYWSFGEGLPVVERAHEIDNPSSIVAAYSRLALLIQSRLDWSSIAATADPTQLIAAQAKAHEKEEEVLQLKRVVRRQTVLQRIATAAVLVITGVMFWPKAADWFKSGGGPPIVGNLNANDNVSMPPPKLSKVEELLVQAESATDPLVGALIACELRGLDGDDADVGRLERIASRQYPMATLQLSKGEYHYAAVRISPNGELLAVPIRDLGVGRTLVWRLDGRAAHAIVPCEAMEFSPSGILFPAELLTGAIASPERFEDLAWLGTLQRTAGWSDDRAACAIIYSELSMLRTWTTSGFSAPCKLPESTNARARMGSQSVRSCVADRSGRFVAFDRAGDGLQLVDTDRCLAVPLKHDSEFRALDAVFGTDLRLVCVSGQGRFDDRELMVFRTDSGTFLLKLPLSQTDRDDLVWLSRDTLRVVTRNFARNVSVLDYSIPGADLRNETTQSSTRSTGGRVAAADWGTLARHVEVSRGDTSIISLSHDGNTLALGMNDGRILKCDVSRDGAEAIALAGVGAEVKFAKFTGDDKRLVTIRTDGSVSVWNMQPPPWPSKPTWESAIKCIRDSTSVTLTVAQRKQILGETEEVARRKHAIDERRFGQSLQGPGADFLVNDEEPTSGPAPTQKP